jgi:hypothetical protein
MAINLSNEQFQSLLDKYVREAVAEMQRRIRSANLVLTGEMIDSFRVSAQERGRDYISQVITFSGVVRLKDLKSMNYTRMPPQEAMEYFVEREGVHSFAYVPGYKNGKWPTTDAIAIKRIAWGIRSKIKQYPNVKRGYRGIHNDILFKGMSSLTSQVAQAGARLAIDEIKNIIQAR